MRLLQKSTRPRLPGGQKLHPVPYPIHRSRISISIAWSLNGLFLTTQMLLLTKQKKRICPAVFLAGPVSDNVYQLPKSTDRLDLGTKLALNDPLLGQEIPI